MMTGEENVTPQLRHPHEESLNIEMQRVLQFCQVMFHQLPKRKEGTDTGIFEKGQHVKGGVGVEGHTRTR